MTEPNYIPKLRRLIEAGAITPGGVTNVVVSHDDHCAIHRGGRCDCDPDIRVRKDEPK